MLFKRILTVWFILFTLVSSVSWAVSDHPEDSLANHAAAQAFDHDPVSPWVDDGCSDHCCHAGAHVLGILSPSITFAEGERSQDIAASARFLFTLVLPPPFQPPIA